MHFHLVLEKDRIYGETFILKIRLRCLLCYSFQMTGIIHQG